MKHTPLFVLAAVTIIGIAVPATAQQSMGKGSGTGMMGGNMMNGGMMGGQGMVRSMMGAQSYAMQTFDTNEDRKFSPEEMTAGIQAELKKYDTDANGTLSLQEFAVMHADHVRPMTVRAFQMNDADGDGQVTEAEIAAMTLMMQEQMSGERGDVEGMDMGKGMMENN